MSTVPDNELDLEKLFLPAWAQEAPSTNKYAKFEGEEDRPDRRHDRRGPRPPRREGGPRREGDRPRRDFGPGMGGGDRPRGGGRREGGFEGRPGGPRGDRRPGPGRREERREPPPPLPEIELNLVPEDKGVESLARQIKIAGRAYPLFDIAQMILQKPDRVMAAFNIKKNAEGQPLQPLFLCALDDTLWLSEDEAVSHVMRKHFGTFYQAERTATEPPKGKYTFVAQCGLSGVIFGPPNHHDYQNRVRKLHTERFSRMPFEVYKSRVRIVRDEEVVKKWVDDQSWKTEYLCLNMPETVKLPTMEAVEQHFRENHKGNIIKAVEAHTLNGTAARNLRSPELARLVRSVWEDQRRFPLRIATVLSQQFASHGLQFFKVNKTITHVSVARPHYLDVAVTPVSEGVRRIVDFINAKPKCTRRQLLEALAPAPPAPPPAPIPVPVAPPAETAEGQPPAPAAAPAAPPPAPEPTAEQTAVISDLHWLIHQGHVIEFANGSLETAKKPVPKPPKPEPKPKAEPAAAAPVEGQAPAAEAEAGAVPATATEAAPAPPVEGESAPDSGPETVPAASAPVEPAPVIPPGPPETAPVAMPEQVVAPVDPSPTPTPVPEAAEPAEPPPMPIAPASNEPPPADIR